MNYDSKIEPGRMTTGEDEAYDAGHNPLTGDAEQDRRSRRWIWLGAILVVALVVGIWFVVHNGEKGADEAGKDAAQIPVVTVVVPGRSTVAGEISATGSLAARRTMPVGSVGEGGEVREIRVEAGDWVKQGQVLAVIDSSVQSQAAASQSAQIQVAAADARIAQSNLDRGLKLVDRGFISKADIDQLTATRDAAAARVGVARATLGQLRAQNARLDIVAPAAGLVLERNVELGQVVGGGTGVLFRLAKGGEMELLANLSEGDLSSLSVGVAAKVTPVGSGETFTGQVWQLSPVIDTTTRQGTARIALPYDAALRPGGFASAVIASGAVVAPMLPESAIQSDAKGSFVYVVDDAGKVHRRPVKTGLVTANGITVPSGLTGTEKIVLRAGGFLNDGDKVKTRLVSATGK
ncbi:MULTISPECIES: efflux RND transporter periplasmic adaptor subunit [unclassified Novosphingobium]|uniref:efflux RND transporter periplasmic adaptor subunit n=1 Tax=unclassified Novosphingobium TaxID=2644732 RepID=UPI0013585BD8|nr:MULTISPECIES: efflux RND transporter periplasmic adaptor subunit [unclassified Novosphingobium]